MMPSSMARRIATHGRLVVLSFAPATSGGAWQDVEVMAHVMGFDPSALAEGSGVQQGDRQMRIAQAELDRREAPRTLAQGDRVLLDEVWAAVQARPDIRYALRRPVLHVVHLRGA